MVCLLIIFASHCSNALIEYYVKVAESDAFVYISPRWLLRLILRLMLKAPINFALYNKRTQKGHRCRQRTVGMDQYMSMLQASDRFS